MTWKEGWLLYLLYSFQVQFPWPILVYKATNQPVVSSWLTCTCVRSMFHPSPGVPGIDLTMLSIKAAWNWCFNLISLAYAMEFWLFSQYWSVDRSRHVNSDGFAWLSAHLWGDAINSFVPVLRHLPYIQHYCCSRCPGVVNCIIKVWQSYGVWCSMS